VNLEQNSIGSMTGPAHNESVRVKTTMNNESCKTYAVNVASARTGIQRIQALALE
jgi:hypothetical protein